MNDDTVCQYECSYFGLVPPRLVGGMKLAVALFSFSLVCSLLVWHLALGLPLVCVCESYIGKPIGTRAVPQFTTGVAKQLTQIEPRKTEHHPPVGTP